MPSASSSFLLSFCFRKVVRESFSESTENLHELFLRKNKDGARRGPCWEYGLEAIIKWFISIFMIIVYSPCYNCINRKHNTCVEYKQPVVPSKPLPDWFVSQEMVRVS